MARHKKERSDSIGSLVKLAQRDVPDFPSELHLPDDETVRAQVLEDFRCIYQSKGDWLGYQTPMIGELALVNMEIRRLTNLLATDGSLVEVEGKNGKKRASRSPVLDAVATAQSLRAQLIKGLHLNATAVTRNVLQGGVAQSSNSNHPLLAGYGEDDDGLLAR